MTTQLTFSAKHWSWLAALDVSMVFVLSNSFVLLFSLLLLWKTVLSGVLPAELPLALETIVLGVVGAAAVVFGISLWCSREEHTRRRAAKKLEAELRAQREIGERLEEKGRAQGVQLTKLDEVVAERERLVRREAEARREREHREQRSTGREFIHLLSRLQEKGRFVDFVMEEIGGYSDQQVGTAARFVHDGCRSVVREYLDLAPVQSGEEGASVTGSRPRHPAELQFLGKSAPAFPLTGRLVHRGWIVPILQTLSSDARIERELLPSMLFSLPEHEPRDSSGMVPWFSAEQHSWIVGQSARERGATLPGRLIASSKSWLCDPVIDRRAPVLPWQPEKNVERMSPVDAAVMLLSHIKHSRALHEENEALSSAQVVITIPASFEESARALTVEAAYGAGWRDVVLPIIEITDPPRERRTTGLRDFGLPYASDPAITKHLAAFLTRSARTALQSEELSMFVHEGIICPTKILFNGGVFNSDRFRARIVDQLSAWKSAASVDVLQQSDLECAVARGAAFYGGVVSRGNALRIRAGLSRSYYIGVEPSELAVPGLQSHMKGVCIAPQGLEEGSGCEIPEREFLLASGESIEFKLFTSNERASDVAGSEVSNAEAMLHEAGTIKATIESPEPYVPVVLQSRLSEIGALEISLRRSSGTGAWRFEFDVRGEVQG